MCAKDDELREYLIDYCGTEAVGGNNAAMAQLQEVELASDDELYEIAEELGVKEDWL